MSYAWLLWGQTDYMPHYLLNAEPHFGGEIPPEAKYVGQEHPINSPLRYGTKYHPYHNFACYETEDFKFDGNFKTGWERCKEAHIVQERIARHIMADFSKKEFVEAWYSGERINIWTL